MFGGGIYSLQSVKEIRVTEGFKSLTEDQKECQTSETYEQCLENLLMTKMEENCQCIPYELKNFSLPNKAIF